jgi:hypothetical protein
MVHTMAWIPLLFWIVDHYLENHDMWWLAAGAHWSR